MYFYLLIDLPGDSVLPCSALQQSCDWKVWIEMMVGCSSVAEISKRKRLINTRSKQASYICTYFVICYPECVLLFVQTLEDNQEHCVGVKHYLEKLLLLLLFLTVLKSFQAEFE